MKELTILDFALGIALLYHWGADGKEIRNFAKRVRNRVEPEYRPLVDLHSIERPPQVCKAIPYQLLNNVAKRQQAAFGRFFFRSKLDNVVLTNYSRSIVTNNKGV